MHIVWIVAGVCAGLYVTLCVLLYLRQDDFLFARVTNDARIAADLQSKRLVIPAKDTKIEAWWLDNPKAQSNSTIIYFGGNAEDVLASALEAPRLHVKKFLVSNYRGYGHTPGKPSGANLFADALDIYDWAIRQPGVDATQIVVMGRSLGSGVATYVAANRSVRATILVTPYDSMAAVAHSHYPMFPVEWLLKHPFPSAQLAVDAHSPALFLAADHDEVIPEKHSRNLFGKWAGPKQYVVIPNTGHNDINQKEEYYENINRFLDTAR